MKRSQYRHHEAAKTSHFSVFDGFDYITFIDVCRVTPPADVEVVNGRLTVTWLLCKINLFSVTMILFRK